MIVSGVPGGERENGDNSGIVTQLRLPTYKQLYDAPKNTSGKNFRITPYIYYAFRMIIYVYALLFLKTIATPKVLNIYVNNYYLL